MSKVYKFSEFILDKQKVAFYRQDVPIQLSSRAFEMLVYLVEKRGEVVEKEEILDKVWKDSFVEEANLAVHISALRRVLNEKKGESRFIRTVSGRGYSFIAEVEEIESKKLIKTIDSYVNEEKKNISIAVLPFTFENSSEDNEYLANGVTQSLIGDLSKIQDLRVLAYSAVKPYKHSELELQEIGFLLDADKIFTGTISEFKGKWEISAELINAGDKRCLWATTQAFEADDIFEIKKEISFTIVEKLKLKLGKSHSNKEIDSEAQKLYYRGKFILESRGTRKKIEDILPQALKFFKEAIKREPTYALAYTGIGSVYVSLHNHNLIERDEAFAEAKKALQLALMADDKLSEAYVLKGSIEIMFDMNFIEAEKTLNKAIELNPNNPDSYHWKSIICLCFGKFEEALNLEEKAVKLDPTSTRFNEGLIRIFFFSGNYNKAIIQSEELLEFDGKLLSAFLFFALSYAQLGSFELAEHHAEKTLKIRENSEMILNKAYIYGIWKKRHLAKELLENSLCSYSVNEIDKVDVAMVYSSINEIESAFEYLTQALNEKSVGLLYLKVDVRFNALKSDKRFFELLEKLNLT